MQISPLLFYRAGVDLFHLIGLILVVGLNFGGRPNKKSTKAQLRPLISWIENDESTRWLKIEKTLCTQAQLAALPFSGNKINADALGAWSRFTIKIWKEVQKEFKLPHCQECLQLDAWGILCRQGQTLDFRDY